jgi:putative pyrimidine permease RutG
MPGEQGGYFVVWTVKTEGIILPEERLPGPQTILVGLQHVVAMFGATVLAPLLMGFDPNVAILFSGIATLIFFVAVGGSCRAISDRASPSSARC